MVDVILAGGQASDRIQPSRRASKAHQGVGDERASVPASDEHVHRFCSSGDQSMYARPVLDNPPIRRVHRYSNVTAARSRRSPIDAWLPGKTFLPQAHGTTSLDYMRPRAYR